MSVEYLGPECFKPTIEEAHHWIGKLFDRDHARIIISNPYSAERSMTKQGFFNDFVESLVKRIAPDGEFLGDLSDADFRDMMRTSMILSSNENKGAFYVPEEDTMYVDALMTLFHYSKQPFPAKFGGGYDFKQAFMHELAHSDLGDSRPSRKHRDYMNAAKSLAEQLRALEKTTDERVPFEVSFQGEAGEYQIVPSDEARELVTRFHDSKISVQLMRKNMTSIGIHALDEIFAYGASRDKNGFLNYINQDQPESLHPSLIEAYDRLQLVFHSLGHPDTSRFVKAVVNTSFEQKEDCLDLLLAETKPFDTLPNKMSYLASKLFRKES